MAPSGVLPQITPGPDLAEDLRRGVGLGQRATALKQQDRALDQADTRITQQDKALGLQSRAEDTRAIAARAQVARVMAEQSEKERMAEMRARMASGDTKGALAIANPGEQIEIFNTSVRKAEAAKSMAELAVQNGIKEAISLTEADIGYNWGVISSDFAGLDVKDPNYGANAADLMAKHSGALALAPDTLKEDLDRLLDSQGVAHVQWRETQPGLNPVDAPDRHTTAKQALLANEGERNNIDALQVLFNPGSVNDAMAAMSQEGGGMRPELVATLTRAVGADAVQKLKDAPLNADVGDVMREFKIKYDEFAYIETRKIEEMNDKIVSENPTLGDFYRGVGSPNELGKNDIPAGSGLGSSERRAALTRGQVVGKHGLVNRFEAERGLSGRLNRVPNRRILAAAPSKPFHARAF